MRFVMMVLMPLLLLAFTKSSPEGVLLQKENPAWCVVCGMNLKKFYKTNHAVKLKNGDYRQYCSIHCLAEDYPHIKNDIDKILVVDAKSGKFIEAKNAYYVVGSRIKGTMSPVSKIAFATKEDAEAFAKEYGGEIKRFDEVFSQALKDVKKENALIAKKKKLMMYPMGEMLYKKYCKEGIKKEDYKTIAQLKSHLAATCPPRVKGKKLQALALYIWEVKDKEHLHVPKDAKCPVCGMFVSKYPRWATMAVVDGKRYYFDGVKDMLKFLKAKKADAIRVQDYYTLEAVDGKKAYYVLGSDVFGPMGKELIPFKTKEAALKFMKEHRGKRVLSFDEIDEKVLKELE